MIYRLTQLETAHRGGVNQSVDAQVRGIGKTNSHGAFTIANEVVAARLGQIIGLPVPAGIIAEDDSGVYYYLSLDVSRTGHTLPPVIAQDFVTAEPRLAAGCVVFDCWIANSDRHAANLSRDEGFDPPRVSFFDHGHALLGTNPGAGPDRLVAARDELGCLGTNPLPGNRQILLDHVADDAALLNWVQRIEQLPEFLITESCHLVAGAGLNVGPKLAGELAEWLMERAVQLRALIRDNAAAFPAIDAWGMLWGPSS